MVEVGNFIEIGDIGNLLLVPLSIIPFILNLRYYRKTKIFEYLLLATYFFLWSFIQFIELWYWGFAIRDYTHYGIVGKYDWWDTLFGKFIFYFWNSFDALPLFIIAIRAKYGTEFSKIPKKVMILAGITFALGLFGWIDQAETRFRADNLATDSLRWALIGNRIIYHSFVVYAFLTTEFQKSSRTIKSRYLWIISSSFWVIGLCIPVIFDWILGYKSYESDALLLLFFAFTLSAASIYVFNHVYYPEAVLFTHEQINIAFSMYETIELSGNRIKDYGLSKIHEYLDSLPDAMKVQ